MVKQGSLLDEDFDEGTSASVEAKDDLNRMGKIMVAVYREAVRHIKDPEQQPIPFTKNEIVAQGDKLHESGAVKAKFRVKNIPDIIYTFRARADLPQEIVEDGKMAIIGAGKGRYAFVRIPRPNRFKLPSKITEETRTDLVPRWVRPYMGTDEQGTLTRAAANDLVKAYLGLHEAFRLQSHKRMGVKKYGQVEVDEVYAGITKRGEHIIIGVEAKDKGVADLLNVSQLFGTAKGLKRIAEDLAVELNKPAMSVRLLGIKPDTDGRICICEFKVADVPSDVKPIGDWKAYVLRAED